ncbi:glycoside hydrolase family 3 protein [Streptococcus suis]|uniref:Beta-glucosidase n=1 Tax=Streptococcus suis TaxID=1307 RepID=A0A116NST5_STRSU|nr:glycoside hydrolase family 3 protein [Streptococcus suis]NQG28955.1 beta-glucosidase [Streptococcus suis]CYW19196.1 beta-glucosidase [Streptococcus suis]HEM5069910.1 glycoside hydrolase family 3 protein [Streptococcus suis]HEP1799052.1 glycoside hydrolase family 3 protein [Streptococcus suis]
MKNLRRTLSALGIILLGCTAIGTAVANVYALKYTPIINTYFGHTDYKIEDKESEGSTTYFERMYSDEVTRLTADSAAGKEAAGEGIVLLKNNSELPLQSGSKVTLLGVTSANILYGGGGSGAVDTSTVPTMKTALEASGFEVNPQMWDFYTTGAAKDIKMDVPDIAGTGRYVIHEASMDLLTDKEKNSFSSYNDAAIVSISRSGGESSDLPKEYDESYLEAMDVKGYVGDFHSDPVDSPEDIGRHYLELTSNEEKLIKYAKENFDKVVLVINSANPIDLGFIEDEEYGVDAALWIGNPGQDGLYALADILNGTINPSGKLVDTYAYDQTGSPAFVNFGLNSVESDDPRGTNYVVYQEGIYVGYKYYETRYEDSVLNQGNATANVGVTVENATKWNYEDEVQFPFGYGLSYTSFSHELVKHSSDENSYTFDVKVTNTGDEAGKEVVQLYMQSPYTEYDKTAGIEKSSVQLVGFVKTEELAPGESGEYTITVDKENLKTYDITANGGEGGYIVEEGNYYFAIATDAHSAVNHILEKKGITNLPEEADSALVVEEKVSSSDKFAVSTATGETITNQFTDTDMSTYDENFTYLSRSDWQATYPQLYQLELTEDIATGLEIPTGTDNPDATMPQTGVDNGLTLAMMREVDFDDPLWDTFLDQLSPEEMYDLVRIGGYQTQAIASVGVPATVHVDGPAYVGVAGLTGVTTKEKTYAWSSEILLASTWNTDILYNMGQLIGEDALAQEELNFAGWYAPAMNIHRTAFSGRNFEYYSEDSFLSGQMGAATTKGATEKGLITFIKHFALNDQETSRAALLTFANEQAIREVYLAPFEESVVEGGALGIMAGMNRVGIAWAGNHTGLMTNVVRNEWGFDGIVVTDQASFPEAFPFMAIRGGLEAGTDLYLNTGTDNWQIEDYQNNPTVITQLRTASKHILYAVSRSLAMNGLSSTSVVKKVVPLWQIWMYSADVVIAIIVGGGIYFLSRNFKKKEEKEEKEVA